MAFPEIVPPARLQVYARHYAELCTTLNNRMLQCIRHFRVGNIAEGIRLAELRPNLSGVYLSLDFAERNEWIEVVSTLGFDVPPPLPVDLARELDEAYLKMAPLEPLLRRHRLHALNGSSIRERLATIRAIARTDRENLFWVTDQEAFEKVRIKELEKEVQKAIETKNTFQIRSLHQELSDPDWVLPPPAHLQERLTGSVLMDYADSLLEKVARSNVDEAINVYNTMQQVLASKRMAMPSAIQQLIRPAVQWIEKAKQNNHATAHFHHRCTILQSALKRKPSVPVPDLQRLYYDVEQAATQAETEIPDALEDLYRSEVDRVHNADTWRNLLIIAGFAVVCVIIIGIVVYAIMAR